MTTDAQRLDLAPPRVTMQWYRGRTVAFSVTVLQDEVGMDITDATVSFTIIDAGGSTIKTYATGGAGIVLTTPASGIMTISPENGTGTADFNVDETYYGDLRVTLASGAIYPFFQARITLTDRRDK